ncbi:MAG: hypothetical protein IBX71_10455 [Candidatus Desulforudis sp.]|nr:hypothetical protein [Desulforudis sp.]
MKAAKTACQPSERVLTEPEARLEKQIVAFQSDIVWCLFVSALAQATVFVAMFAVIFQRV